MEKQNLPLLWDLEETANQLGGVSARLVKRLLDRGDLRAQRVGRRLLVNVQSVLEYIDQAPSLAHNSPCAGAVCGTRPEERKYAVPTQRLANLVGQLYRPKRQAS
ncbi:helix-turn-helix domain-containing protein [Thiorhodovibrio frisius]|uniref:helix-turn-helix domain-containing protein n=1 Tax=Thiorhodovibrio frisius TaxID=631362 RepID=UPI0036F2A9DB